MADESNNGFGIGWFLAGLGLGALLGVLYAPKSGRETREDLVSTAIDAKKLRDAAREYAAKHERGQTSGNLRTRRPLSAPRSVSACVSRLDLFAEGGYFFPRRREPVLLGSLQDHLNACFDSSSSHPT